MRRAVAVAVVAWGLAFASTGVARPGAKAREGAMKGKAPEPVLVESWVTSALSGPEGWRILQDGAWWSFADRYNEFDAKARKVVERTGPRQWRQEEPRLTAAEAGRIQAAIRDLRVMELPAGPPPRSGRVMDGTTVRWTFSLEGRTHAVTWMPDVDVAPAAVKAVEELADELTFRAQQRWLKDHGLDHTPED